MNRDVLKPLWSILPTVSKPIRKVSFTEKILWTTIVLIVYLIMSEMPLYGVKAQPQDPLYYLRVIFASSNGTLMELGIGPIVTAGLFMQILQGSKLIKLNLSNPEDRALFTSANKLFAIVMTLVQAVTVTVRYNADLQTTGVILLQLMIAGVLLMLMDEMLQKGWGLGSGISLFIVAGTMKTIWWDLFAPAGPMADGKFYGAVIAYIQGLMSGEGPLAIFFRKGGLPSMSALLLTVVVFLFFTYIESVKINIPLVHDRFRGIKGGFPIKLLYVSVIPAIFASMLLGNGILLLQTLSSRMSGNMFVNVLGAFNATTGQPTGGLAYFLVPPRGVAVDDPVRTIVYMAIFIVLAVVFSMLWVQLSGMDSKAVANNLLQSGVHIPGYRQSEKPIMTMLDRYIPTVTIISGLMIGIIVPVTDIMNIFGGGTGVLLAVDILFSYYQLIVRERVEETYPALARFLR